MSINKKTPCYNDHMKYKIFLLQNAGATIHDQKVCRNLLRLTLAYSNVSFSQQSQKQVTARVRAHFTHCNKMIF